MRNKKQNKIKGKGKTKTIVVFTLLAFIFVLMSVAHASNIVGFDQIIKSGTFTINATVLNLTKFNSVN